MICSVIVIVDEDMIYCFVVNICYCVVCLAFYCYCDRGWGFVVGIWMYFCIYYSDPVFLKVIDWRIYYLAGCIVAVLVNYFSLFAAYCELEVAVLAWAREIVMVLGVSLELRLMLLLGIF